MGCATTGGTCTPKPALSNVLSPVCGCDNVTYWNMSTAAAVYGVTAKAAGECATPATCTASGAVNCPAKRSCNLSLASFAMCGGIGGASGTCWGLPPTCAVQDGKYTACIGSNGGNCTSLCAAIKAEKPFYPDGSCMN